MSKKENHGKRNKKLCHKLYGEKEYFDWVITTAFYSAIHFVEDSILPITINQQYCSNIDEVKKAYRMRGRHASRERLVSENVNYKVTAKYKWLDDKSRYARYTTYKVTKLEAEKAKQYLNEIYNECYLKEEK